MVTEQDGVVRWAPPQQGRVVSLARVRAEQAEQRAAVLAGRAATYESRVLPLQQSRDRYRADYLRLSRERRRLLIITWGTVGLGAVLAVLAAIACLWAMGWRGPLLVGGIVVATAAWIALPKWGK